MITITKHDNDNYPILFDNKDLFKINDSVCIFKFNPNDRSNRLHANTMLEIINHMSLNKDVFTVHYGRYSGLSVLYGLLSYNDDIIAIVYKNKYNVKTIYIDKHNKRYKKIINHFISMYNITDKKNIIKLERHELNELTFKNWDITMQDQSDVEKSKMIEAYKKYITWQIPKKIQ